MPVRPATRAQAPLPPGDAFTPTRPKAGRRQLTGRKTELVRIVQALRDEKAHVVLYSERGRGKTSLANLVVESLRVNGITVARHACDAGSSFDGIIRGLARDLPPALLATVVGRDDGEGCEAALPDGELQPRDIVALPSRLACRSLVCVIDEFDRVLDTATRTRLADTIKQLSDRAAALSFMIVGVSDNLDQILGQHPSIQRNLVAVQLPLLTDAEIGAVVVKGAQQAGFAISDRALTRIAVLARGSPYMAQVLGLRLTQAATERADTAISEADIRSAVTRLVVEASPSDVSLYAVLTANGRDREMAAALRRIAGAEQDSWGRLHAVPAATGGVAIGSQSIPAGIWSRIEAAGALRGAGEGPGIFIFAARSFMYYILLLAAATHVIDDAPVQDDGEAALGGARVRLMSARA